MSWGTEYSRTFENSCGCYYKKWIKTCKYCGCPDLHWEYTPYGWRLHDVVNRMHQCGTPESREIIRLSNEVEQLKREVGDLKFITMFRLKNDRL